MENLIFIAVCYFMGSILNLVRTYINQYYRHKRFKEFKTTYENECFEKLSDYEKNTKAFNNPFNLIKNDP
ncbi:hypothetical protein [uncultured Flavobacterium sp.]|uniref:hypothetical protein n=1 Tax=uncultured Flavobacterium sp. TaxID=165435 RepID=UPI0030C8972E